MSKELLKRTFENALANSYSWSLYFFKIDRRARNPFQIHKVRFRNQQYLKDYITNLASIVLVMQIEKINSVQEYDGQNTKISCDKLSLSDDLISEQWSSFQAAVQNASDEKLEGKINGYIVVGQPSATNKTNPPLVMVKAANPVIDFKNKRFITYKDTEENALDVISDKLYRLYLTVDFIVFKGNMYTFNHCFEAVFDIEKTLAKVKENAVDKIVETNCVADAENFQRYLSQYKSPKTFITLNSSRLQQVSKKTGRKKIAKLLNLGTVGNDLMDISDMSKATLLIKFLCYKIFQEADTKDVLEATTVTKVHV